MKICDLTQFYSPVSGGVRRYIEQKVSYVRKTRRDWQHVLVVPGEATATHGDDLSRIYTIASPLVSRTSRYRALLKLHLVEEVLEREKPDIIESGDPYQLAWKAIASGQGLDIPVVGFYHSHFPEAYIRSVAKYFGQMAISIAEDISRRYVRTLYNRLERTFVPSPTLAALLKDWGSSASKASISGWMRRFSVLMVPLPLRCGASSKFRKDAGFSSMSAAWRWRKMSAPFLMLSKFFTAKHRKSITYSPSVTALCERRLRDCRIRPAALPGYVIAENRRNSHHYTAHPTCSFIRESRKLSGWSLSRVKPAALPWLASGAVTWIASFFPVNSIGQSKTRHIHLLTPSRQNSARTSVKVV